MIGFPGFGGRIDLDAGVYELVEDRMRQLKEHYDDFLWLYGELSDYRSKKVLYGILYCWLHTYDEYKSGIKETNFADYYDFDLLRCDENEVVVDLGAFTGDSAESYIENFANYKRIYCYEITKSSMAQMQKNLGKFENIVYRNVGVGKEKGEMYMEDAENTDSANRLGCSGKDAVPVVTLDEDISEPVTLIKMDIEGSELDALEGAKRHIETEHPKLAVCTYHNNHHIWEVPRKMKEYNPEYKLYMRYNGGFNSFLLSEFVTFAI